MDHYVLIRADPNVSQEAIDKFMKIGDILMDIPVVEYVSAGPTFTHQRSNGYTHMLYVKLFWLADNNDFISLYKDPLKYYIDHPIHQRARAEYLVPILDKTNNNNNNNNNDNNNNTPNVIALDVVCNSSNKTKSIDDLLDIIAESKASSSSSSTTTTTTSSSSSSSSSFIGSIINLVTKPISLLFSSFSSTLSKTKRRLSLSSFLIGFSVASLSILSIPFITGHHHHYHRLVQLIHDKYYLSTSPLSTSPLSQPTQTTTNATISRPALSSSPI